MVELQVGVEGIGLDLVPDLCGVTLHPRVAAVSTFPVVFGHVGLLAAQGAGPGVHGPLRVWEPPFSPGCRPGTQITLDSLSSQITLDSLSSCCNVNVIMLRVAC